MKQENVIYHADMAKARIMLADSPSLSQKFQLPKDDETLMLSRVFFRNLTDSEFTIVYNMPLKIIVTENTNKYIDNRRRELNLKRPLK